MIRRLGAADAEAYVALRRAALAETPLAFAASPEDDPAASADAVREELGSAGKIVLFGAFDPDLAGAVGLHRDRRAKSAHKIHLWGMYVLPQCRHRGLAAALLDAALDYCRSQAAISWAHVSVTEAAEGARRLYERAGFRIWGTEPDALRHARDSVAEHHMALRLGRPGKLRLP